MSDDERREWDMKLPRLDAEIAALNAETAKALREVPLPPVVLAATVIGVRAPVVTALLGGLL